MSFKVLPILTDYQTHPMPSGKDNADQEMYRRWSTLNQRRIRIDG